MKNRAETYQRLSRYGRKEPQHELEIITDMKILDSQSE